MEFITGSIAIMALIISSARQIDVPPEMILAMIHVESTGNPYATKFNQNYSHVDKRVARPVNCDPNTEAMLQRTAWGLMQVMGSTARGLGFTGWLTELTEPEKNIAVGVQYIAQVKQRFFKDHGLDGVIAAYNKGAPRKGPDGRFENQNYVNRVKALMPQYAVVVAAFEKEHGEKSDEQPSLLSLELLSNLSPEELAKNLDEPTVKELTAFAETISVEIPKKANKSEIIALLVKAILPNVGEENA